MRRVWKAGLVLAGLLAGLAAPARGADLYVTSGNKVGVFDGSTGAWKYDFGSISQPEGIALAPNGKIWVASNGGNCIYRYNSWNNQLADTLTGVSSPMGLTFGPDGNCYVAERVNARIHKFNGATGANLGVFATLPGSPVLTEGVAFGPDGNLYVTTRQPVGMPATVERFNGSTGAFMGTFATVPNDYWATGITFSTWDWAGMWVMGYASSTFNRFNPTTGAFASQWGGHSNGIGVVQGPNTYPYTANSGENRIVRYTAGWSGPAGFAATNMATPQFLSFITPITPPQASLAGKVSLQGYGGDPAMVGVRIELRPNGGGGSITKTVLLSADGSFSIDNVTPGSYDIAIKACSWLQRIVSSVNVSSNPTDIGTVLLLSGDLGNDNKVNSADLSLVLANLDLKGDTPAISAWAISPYVNIIPTEAPSSGTPVLARIDVSMARNEYRDTVLMISGNTGSNRQIAVSLETTDPALAATTVIQEALYVYNTAGQLVGDAHYPLAGPLTIPQNQSRQLRLRFSSQAGGLSAGPHDFVLRLTDTTQSSEQTIPGSVTVWDFALPDPALVMSNDTYAQLTAGTSLSDLTDLMVPDMKAYGLNVFWVHPFEVSNSRPNGSWQFSFTKLDQYVSMVMSNWGSGTPPQFIFSLGYGIMPNPMDLPAWVSQFRSIVESHGVPSTNWYFVFGDESDENGIINFELPQGETLKAAAPYAKISTNTSAMVSDPTLRARFFATVDRWEPDLDIVHTTPALLPYLRTSGKPINSFRCRGDYTIPGANLYNYYRVYGWEAAADNLTGMGLWTYSVDYNADPWTGKENQFALVFRHPTQRALVHSRRYEAFREGVDDYRYIWKLRDVAKTKGTQAQAGAETLIQSAVNDILANVTDTGRCDQWRLQIAQRILSLSAAP